MSRSGKRAGVSLRTKVTGWMAAILLVTLLSLGTAALVGLDGALL